MFPRGLIAGPAALLTAALLVWFAGPAEAAGPYAGGSPGGYNPGYFSRNAPAASYYQGQSYPRYIGNFPGGYYPGYFANYNNPYAPSVNPGYIAPAPSTNPYQPPAYTQTPYNRAMPSRLDGGATTTYTSGPVDVTVHVPANAEVWFDGDATKQQGEWREFESPPLAPNRDYTYEVRARWTAGGKPVEQTRTVTVRAHDTVEVDFTRP